MSLRQADKIFFEPEKRSKMAQAGFAGAKLVACCNQLYNNGRFLCRSVFGNVFFNGHGN